MSQEKLSLSKAVDSLRKELNESFNKRPKEGIVFNIGAVELELQVVVESASKDELGGEWSLLGWKAGGKVEGTDSQTGVHKVKLSLDVYYADKEGNLSKVAIGSESSDRR